MSEAKSDKKYRLNHLASTTTTTTTTATTTTLPLAHCSVVPVPALIASLFCNLSITIIYYLNQQCSAWMWQPMLLEQSSLTPHPPKQPHFMFNLVEWAIALHGMYMSTWFFYSNIKTEELIYSRLYTTL